ncbi:MAG: flagellar biosynthetic protein FliO [Candidatus Sulfotelmatobacter sp.]
MTTETLPFFASPWWLRARALWQRVSRLSRRTPRRLRLRETLPLGEHRFVAVIEFERRRLLIGGTPSSLVLLAHLGSDPADTGEDPSGFAETQAVQSAGTEIEGFALAEREEEKRSEEGKREAL